MKNKKGNNSYAVGPSKENKADGHFAEKLHKIESKYQKLIDDLKRREEKFRLFYERSPLGYQSLNKRGSIIEVNQAWLDIFGYSREEVIGKWFGDFLTARYKDEFKRQFDIFKAEGEVHNVLFEMIKKDGSRIIVEFDGKIGYDEKGNFQQTHCVMRDVTKRKLLENRLRLLASVVDQCREGLAVSDMEGRLLFMNKSFAEMHGYEVSDLLGKDNSVFRASEQLSVIESANKETRETGEFKGEVLHVRKDGTVFPCFIHNSLLKNRLGKPIGIISTVLDITGLKHAEEQMRRERDKAQKYLDIAGVVFVAIGADRKVSMVNKKGCEILGYTQQEIIGTDWFDNYLRPEDKEEVSEVFAAGMREEFKSKEYFENFVLAKSGEEKLILWHNTALKDDSGNVVGTLSSGLDITERKQAEERLREQYTLAIALCKTSELKEALELILEAAVAIKGVDSGGVYLFNEKTGTLDLIVHKGLSKGFIEKVAHYKGDEPNVKLVLSGETVYRPIDDFRFSAFRGILEQEGLRSLFVAPIVHKGKVIGSLNLASHRYEQISKPMRGTVEMLAAQVGGVVVRVKAEQALQEAHNELERKVQQRTAQLSQAYRELEAEIAERQRKEKLLFESEKLAAACKLAAKIAHEINNPLAGIKNSFLLIKDAVPKDYQYYEYVELIEKEISRVSRIVHQMLELYRPKRQLPTKFYLAKIVSEVVTLQRISAQECGVRVRIDIDESLVVRLAEGLFRQVLFNIIQNAIEASGLDSTVSISARISGDLLTVKVRDEGSGIKEDIREKVFEPFFTTKEGTVAGGLGLGLSVSKSIIDAMGGKIEVESEEGKGSIFSIIIPMKSEENSANGD